MIIEDYLTSAQNHGNDGIKRCNTLQSGPTLSSTVAVAENVKTSVTRRLLFDRDSFAAQVWQGEK